MILIQIGALSLLIGFVVGGSVWYGWALVRNIRAIRRHALIQAATQQAEEKKPERKR